MSRADNIFNLRFGRVDFHGDKSDPDYEKKYHPRNRLKDPLLRDIYDDLIRRASDKKSNLYIKGERRTGGYDRNAFWMGVDGIKPAWLEKNTPAYAAWVAGKDFKNKFTRVDFHGTKSGPNADPDYDTKFHPTGQGDLFGHKYPVKPPYEGAETKRLYNASTVDFDPDGYLEPHVSGWVEEVAGGTGYEGDTSEITSDLVFMDDEPTGWIEIIVGRKVGKNNPTLDDVRDHGRLNIIDADLDQNIYNVGDYWYTQEVTNLYGDRIKFWESNIYDEGDVYSGEGRMVDMPVGPEPNDWISRDSVEVSYSITGDDLIEYIKDYDPDLYDRLSSR